MSRGFDKEAINSQLLFGLTLEERVGATGLFVYDRAKPHHTCTLYGATIAWGSLASGIPYIDLTRATPDWIDCPAAETADLDFQAGDFSVAAWVNRDTLVGSHEIFCRGRWNIDGWEFVCPGGWGGAFNLGTYQAGADQMTYSLGLLVINTWFLVGATRSGANVRCYLNGIDQTDPANTAVHVNPLTANRELHIGIWDNEVIGAFDGKLALPRIWGRKLSAEEMHELWNRERGLFAL